MTEQIPADKVRKIDTAMRAAMRRVEDDYPDGEFLMDMSDYIRDLDKICAHARPRPTLADMTEEERAACQWMQCDVETWGRAVIVLPNERGGRTVTLNRRGHMAYEDHTDVTPRPDLPRMKWPGTEKPAPDPAPALPGGWRLADHENHGRVIVTNPTPTRDGRVYCVLPAADPRGYDWLWCDHSELTFLDQEANQ